jgi:hypothetical protein
LPDAQRGATAGTRKDLFLCACFLKQKLILLFQMMNYEHIRARYNVPARRGARVEFQGQLGTVTSTSSAAVRVRMDGMTRSQPFAPDELHWLDVSLIRPDIPASGSDRLAR